MFKNFFSRLVNFVKEHILFLFNIFLLFVLVLSLLTSCQGLFNVNVKDAEAEVLVNDSFKGGE